MPDHPALEAYNREHEDVCPDCDGDGCDWCNETGKVYADVTTVARLADAMRDELLARIKALEAELAAERGKRCGTCGWFQLKSWSPRPQCMCDECSFDEEPGPYYGCVHWTSAEQGATDE